MKTILFIIFILLISLKVSAEPNKLFIDLMNTKVDRLTYGINKCGDFLDENKSLLELKVKEMNSEYNIMSRCDYNWEKNEIQIYITILEVIYPATNLTNKQCKEIISLTKTIFNLYPGSGASLIASFFQSSGFSIKLDEEVEEKIDNHTLLKISDGLEMRCETSMKDEKVLYYK